MQQYLQAIEATDSDVPGIIATLRESWLAAYMNEMAGVTKEKIELLYSDTEDRTKRWLTRIEAKDPIWVAKDNNIVIGVVAPKIEDTKHRVGAIYVRPEAFGKGVGRALLQKVLELYKGYPIYLDVVSYNARAKAFYEHMGFEYTGKVQNFKIERVGISMPVEEMVYPPKE